MKNMRNSIGLLIIAVLIIGIGGCGKREQRSAEETSPSQKQRLTRRPGATATRSAATSKKLLTAREAYDLAVERAREDYGNVYLKQLTAGGGTVGLSTLKEKVGDDGRACKWDVVFVHPDDQTYLQILAVVENNEVRWISAGKPLKIYGEWDNFVRVWTLDVEKCKVTGAEAVRIADENGGDKFTRIMLRLVKEGGCPRWIVAFGPSTREKGKHPGLFIRINGETGEVTGKKTKMYHVH